MKKIVALIALGIMVFMLTACGSFKCDMCGQEKSGTKHTEKIPGKEAHICDDCYKGLEALGGLMGL